MEEIVPNPELMQELRTKYCWGCGSQRCTGEGEWLEGCPHYRELLKKYEDNN